LRLIENLIEKRRRVRSEVETAPVPVRRSRPGITLDKFEAWGGDEIESSVRSLPAELVAESLKSIHELAETLVYHAENRTLVSQEEIDYLQNKLKDICTRLGLLQEELVYLKNPL
jgi:hypothetical protein